MHLRKYLHRAIDALLTLLPGSRTDPQSIEARFRRNGMFFSNTITRQVERCNAVIQEAGQAAERIEEAALKQAASALRSTEVALDSMEQRAKHLRKLIEDYDVAA